MLSGQVSTDLCFKTIQRQPRNIALLIGAGCSDSAGIPVSGKIVEEVWRTYSERFKEPPLEDERSYNTVVERLTQEEFLQFMRPYLNSAKVNLAHLCIAELVRRGIVDRILTTNFDTLLIQACAMAGVYPAVYDCVAIPDLTRVFDSELPAVYYLHGQTYGLRILNLKDELDEHSSQVREIVHHNIKRRPLVIIGYSGTCDGVLEQLKTAHTQYPVFWVPFSEADARHTLEAFSGRRHRWVLEEYDADEFFYDLLLSLELTAPVITSDVNLFAAESRQHIRLPAWFPCSRAGRTTRRAGASLDGEVEPEETDVLVPKPPPSNWTVERAVQPADAGS